MEGKIFVKVNYFRLFDNPGFQMAYRKRTSPADHEEQNDCEQPQAADELCGDHQER
jgi:hypothetical protein